MNPNQKLYNKAKRIIAKGAGVGETLEAVGLSHHNYTYWRDKERGHKPPSRQPKTEITVHNVAPKTKYKKTLQKSDKKFAVVFLTLRELADLA